MITDKQYEEAWENVENQKIMNNASACYVQTIPIDDLKQCKRVALWEAMRDYKPQKSQFFTYLHNKVRWACLDWLRQFKRSETIQLSDDVPYEESNELSDALNGLSLDTKNILIKRYYYCMTLKEIAKDYNCSYETIRREIDDGLKQMKKLIF